MVSKVPKTKLSNRRVTPKPSVWMREEKRLEKRFGKGKTQHVRSIIEQISKIVRSKTRSLFGRKLTSLKHLFVALDRDGDGEISGDELRVGMRRLGIAITEKQLEYMRKGFDRDGNGLIGEEVVFLQNESSLIGFHLI